MWGFCFSFVVIILFSQLSNIIQVGNNKLGSSICQNQRV
jgi:hypothetical protein